MLLDHSCPSHIGDRRVWYLPDIMDNTHGVRERRGKQCDNRGRPRANPREPMARMGHDSAWVALIYLHSSAERLRSLAKVGKTAKAALSKPAAKPKRSGTRVAHNRRTPHEDQIPTGQYGR